MIWCTASLPYSKIATENPTKRSFRPPAHWTAIPILEARLANSSGNPSSCTYVLAPATSPQPKKWRLGHQQRHSSEILGVNLDPPMGFRMSIRSKYLQVISETAIGSFLGWNSYRPRWGEALPTSVAGPWTHPASSMDISFWKMKIWREVGAGEEKSPEKVDTVINFGWIVFHGVKKKTQESSNLNKSWIGGVPFL